MVDLQSDESAKGINVNATRQKSGYNLTLRVVLGNRSPEWSEALITALFVVFLLSFVRLAVSEQTGGEYRTIKRVIDGDTLVLESGERVRLIGVDAPETKHPQKPVQYFGKEAVAFTRKMVQEKKVKLEFEQANSPTGHKDKYGRTLAYVFLEDGTFLNAEIIRQGYGFAYIRFPFRHLEEFRRLERDARKQGKGLWGKGN